MNNNFWDTSPFDPHHPFFYDFEEEIFLEAPALNCAVLSQPTFGESGEPGDIFKLDLEFEALENISEVQQEVKEEPLQTPATFKASPEGRILEATPFTMSVNASFPPPFLEKETARILSSAPSAYLYTANLFYPNIQLVEKGILDKKNSLSSSINHEASFREYCHNQMAIIQEIRQGDGKHSTQKLFRFFALSAKLDLIIFNPSYYEMLSSARKATMRSFNIAWLNHFPYYYLWQIANEEQRKDLEKALTSFFRLLRPTKMPSTFPDFNHPHFSGWLKAILNKVVLESKCIEKNFLPHSKIVKRPYCSKPAESSPVSTEVATLYKKALMEDLLEIEQASAEKIHAIFREFKLYLPYCGQVTAKEYLSVERDAITLTPADSDKVVPHTYSLIQLSNGKKTFIRFLFRPYEIHRGGFFLTYMSPNNYLHSWGHEESQKHQKHTFSRLGKKLRFSLKNPAKKLEDLEHYKNNGYKELIQEISQKLCLDASFSPQKTSSPIESATLVIKEKKYQVCREKCPVGKVHLDLFQMASVLERADFAWEHLSRHEKLKAIEIFKEIHRCINQENFIAAYKKAIRFKVSGSSKNEKTLELNLNNRDIHALFYPLFKIAFRSFTENTKAASFVLDQVIKIFQICYCDLEKYKITLMDVSEEESLINFLLKFVPIESSNPTEDFHFSIKECTDYLCKIKRKEISTFINELEVNDKVLDLSFEKHLAIVVSRGKDQKYTLTPVKLISNDFGLHHMEHYHNAPPKIHDFASNYHLDSCYDLIPFLEFVAECWAEKEQVIPIFANSARAITKPSSKTKNLFRISAEESRTSKLRRRKLAANTPKLKSLVKSYREKNKEKESEKIEKKKDELELSIQGDSSILCLPNFLLDLKYNQGDVFLNLSKELMIQAYNEQAIENFNRQSNSPHFTFFAVPNDGPLQIEERHRKTHLIHSLRNDQSEAIAQFEVWKETGCGGIFADEPGVGKTRKGCEILIRSLLESPDQPCVVIAPSLVKGQWVAEFWDAVGTSARHVAAHAKKSDNEEYRKKGAQLWDLAIRDRRSSQIFFVQTTHKHLTEQEIERLDQLIAFYTHFKKEDIRAITSPKEFLTLMNKAQKEPIKGVIIAQYSYFETQFNPAEPNYFAKLNPSVVILDEAHELLTLSEHPGKLGKTSKFDYMFRKWKCPKLGLTATPLVNDIYDIVDLLMLITNKDRKFEAAEHFERLLFMLADQFIDLKLKHEKLIEENSADLNNITALVQKNSSQITFLAHKLLGSFFWLKEKMVNPLLSRVTREEILTAQGSQDLIKEEFSLIITPTEEQYKLHDRIYKTCGQKFFKFTRLISSLLIHPDLVDIHKFKLINSQKLEYVLNAVNKKSAHQLDEYIKQSALLHQLFLTGSKTPKHKTLADAIANDEKAIIFADQIIQAEFIKALAMKRFGLTATQAFAVHSKNAYSEAEVEAFKKLKGKGLIILLPKSGGSGLNFTDVCLNILISVGWTHKDEEQCAGRFYRGKGIRHLCSVSYPFKTSQHIKNIVKKKELFSDLFLDKQEINQDSVAYWLEKIIRAAEAILLAQLDHCVPSEEWTSLFELLTQQLREGSANSQEIWNQYLKHKERTESPPLKRMISSLPAPEKVGEKRVSDISEEDEQDIKRRRTEALLPGSMITRAPLPPQGLLGNILNQLPPATAPLSSRVVPSPQFLPANNHIGFPQGMPSGYPTHPASHLASSGMPQPLSRGMNNYALPASLARPSASFPSAGAAAFPGQVATPTNFPMTMGADIINNYASHTTNMISRGPMDGTHLFQGNQFNYGPQNAMGGPSSLLHQMPMNGLGYARGSYPQVIRPSGMIGSQMPNQMMPCPGSHMANLQPSSALLNYPTSSLVNSPMAQPHTNLTQGHMSTVPCQGSAQSPI